jgi:hypothetical protein
MDDKNKEVDVKVSDDNKDEENEVVNTDEVEKVDEEMKGKDDEVIWNEDKKQDETTNNAVQLDKQVQPSKTAVKNQQANHLTSKISNKFDSAIGVFDIFGVNFKEKLATNSNKAIKSDALDVYVSGPFRNARTKQTHYVVVFGSFGGAWTLKDLFLHTYLYIFCSEDEFHKGFSS